MKISLLLMATFYISLTFGAERSKLSPHAVFEGYYCTFGNADKFYQAENAIATGQFGTALDLLNEVTELVDIKNAMLAQIAYAYFQEGDYTKAKNTMLQAGMSEHEIYSIGLKLFFGDADGALKKYKKTIIKD